MADIKQLKIKIQSTKNIKKITNAMEVISTIKLQKVKKKTEHLRDYMNGFLGMLSTIGNYVSLFPQAEKSSQTRELVILVSSEKWLCGSLNTVLFKQFHSQYDKIKDSIDVFTIGKKAKDFCIRRGYTTIGSLLLSDNFDSDDLMELNTLIDTSWKSSRYTTIRVRYNYFKNTMKQMPIGFQLFPLSTEWFREFMTSLDISLPQQSIKALYDEDNIKLEPNKETIIRKAYEVMMNVIVYGAVLHNKTGEFAARMLAMKWAKDNAKTIISDLTLAYNKARQDAITKEVLEIVSAKAVIED